MKQSDLIRKMESHAFMTRNPDNEEMWVVPLVLVKTHLRQLEAKNEALQKHLVNASSILGYYLMEMGATTGEAWEEMRQNDIPHLEYGEMWVPPEASK